MRQEALAWRHRWAWKEPSKAGLFSSSFNPWPNVCLQFRRCPHSPPLSPEHSWGHSPLCDVGTGTLSVSLTSVCVSFHTLNARGSHESESSQNANFTLVNVALLLSTRNLAITPVKYS